MIMMQTSFIIIIIKYTYPQREEDDAADQTEDGVLRPHSGDVVEDVDIVVHHPGVGVALVGGVDAHAQETLPLAAGDGEGGGRGEAGDHLTNQSRVLTVLTNES